MGNSRREKIMDLSCLWGAIYQQTLPLQAQSEAAQRWPPFGKHDHTTTKNKGQEAVALRRLWGAIYQQTAPLQAQSEAAQRWPSLDHGANGKWKEKIKAAGL